ncbi:Predicted membrane protein [Slackia heliotrinireducens]|uniref:Zinc-ribbon domain-containing protein n=1 Tax=Slackia heliotrinireducens (strain ATCC 29202 / DSM 20476 / NCTC 11029 / RHS 1) TaxID=471855 RepID=C7N1J4_SLAHD|nr:zinc ribbon domain-containing protein [Slackia heliotrinireducens]ACV21286.1 hypothetical protein Shel_02160 [Slackia heliotrinireducens DSM 20476]VEG98721.1 Predicted membrane protein [Slackia heliotrinireducens]
MFCPHCGTQLPDGSAFCANCGSQLNAAPNPAPAPMPGYGGAVAQPTGSFDIKKFLPIIIAVAAVALLLILFLVIRPFGGSGNANLRKLVTMEPEEIAQTLDKMESVKVDGQRVYVSSEEFGELLKDTMGDFNKKEAEQAEGEWAFYTYPEARDLEDGEELTNIYAIKVYASTDELTCDKVLSYVSDLGLKAGTYACYVDSEGEYAYITSYTDDYSINMDVRVDNHATITDARIYTDEGYALEDAIDEVESAADALEDDMEAWDYREIATNVK